MFVYVKWCLWCKLQTFGSYIEGLLEVYSGALKGSLFGYKNLSKKNSKETQLTTKEKSNRYGRFYLEAAILVSLTATCHSSFDIPRRPFLSFGNWSKIEAYWTLVMHSLTSFSPFPNNHPYLSPYPPAPHQINHFRKNSGKKKSMKKSIDEVRFHWKKIKKQIFLTSTTKSVPKM